MGDMADLTGDRAFDEWNEGRSEDDELRRSTGCLGIGVSEISRWRVESLEATLRIAQLGSNDDTNPTWDDFEQALAVVNATVAQLAWAESEIALLRHQLCGGAE